MKKSELMEIILEMGKRLPMSLFHANAAPWTEEEALKVLEYAIDAFDHRRKEYSKAKHDFFTDMRFRHPRDAMNNMGPKREEFYKYKKPFMKLAFMAIGRLKEINPDKYGSNHPLIRKAIDYLDVKVSDPFGPASRKPTPFIKNLYGLDSVDNPEKVSETKNTMKKSELKQLIREIVEELGTDDKESDLTKTPPSGEKFQQNINWDDKWRDDKETARDQEDYRMSKLKEGPNGPVVNIGRLGPDYYINFPKSVSAAVIQKLDADGHDVSREVKRGKDGMYYLFFQSEQEAKEAKYHAER